MVYHGPLVDITDRWLIPWTGLLDGAYHGPLVYIAGRWGIPRWSSGPFPVGCSALRSRLHWYQVLGTKYLVPSTWYQVLGIKYLVPGTWYQVLGTWLRSRDPSELRILKKMVHHAHDPFCSNGTRSTRGLENFWILRPGQMCKIYTFGSYFEAPLRNPRWILFRGPTVPP